MREDPQLIHRHDSSLVAQLEDPQMSIRYKDVEDYI